MVSDITLDEENEMTKPVGPYSPIVRAGDLLLVSGQIGIVDGALVGGGLVAQTHQVFDNLEAVLATEGAALTDIVRCGVFLTDMGDFAALNDLYVERFAGHRPARAAVGVAALPLGAVVEIEATAYLPR